MNDGHRSPPGFADLLETAATWVLLASLGWGVLLVLAAVAERLSRGRLPALRWAGCPHRARPLLLALAGLAVLLPVTATPAQGATPPTGRSGTGGEVPGRVLPVPSRPVDGGPPPGARAAVRPAPPPPADPTPGSARAVTLTVRAGDSLWSLARDRLGPGADAAAVASLVTRVHHRNRDVVGPDPDLLRPGQQLRFPATPPPQEAAP